MKILCFHPALAPYRIDFFNLLSRHADLKIFFLQKNLVTQRFDQKELRDKLRCKHGELTRGFDIRQRSFRFGIVRAMLNCSPDVILSYEASPVTLELIVLRKLGLHKAQIWTFMDDSPSQVKLRTGVRRVIRDWVVRNVDKVIVPSQQAADAYPLTTNDNQLKTKHFAVVPIIHDTDVIRKNATWVCARGNAWKNDNVPKGWTRMLLFVGRLAEVKNLPWLMERMLELPKTTGLVIVGDGPLEHDLKAAASAMGLEERVIFAGRKEADELYAVMSAADALVLCSHSETFGAVVAEALQWGTPCAVAGHLGAAVLIQDGVNGVVFSLDDVKNFNESLDRMPAHSDESLLELDLRSSVERLLD